MGERLYPHQIGTTEKCNFCAEKIDAGLERGLRPGIDRDATPACVNTCQARAMTFGNLDDPDSTVSQLSKSLRAIHLLEDSGAHPKTLYLQEG